MNYPKRLIEVDLPIKRISEHARREKSIRQGHISAMHIWWARRPLAACRAVLCAALWADPVDEHCPQSFRDEAATILCDFAEKVRTDPAIMRLSHSHWSRWHRTTPSSLNPKLSQCWPDMRYALLDFIADFANWDSSTIPIFLETARALTQAAHVSLGGIPGTPALVVDPFAGGGSFPLEAVRVGANAIAADLNPIAALLNKVTLEYIPRYGQRLIDEVRNWGEWIKEQANHELGEFYPNDSDGATPIVYLWARTITCEGPGCGVEVPIIKNQVLSSRKGFEAAVKISYEDKTLKMQVITGIDALKISGGTSRRSSVTCPVCCFTTPRKHVEIQANVRGFGYHMYAICIKKPDGHRAYRSPNSQDITILDQADQALAKWYQADFNGISAIPNEELPYLRSIFNVRVYGIDRWYKLYHRRQLLSAIIFTSIVRKAAIEVRQSVKEVALASAVAECLALSVSQFLQYGCDIATYLTEGVKSAFIQGQSLPMEMDFVEANPLMEDLAGGYNYSLMQHLSGLDYLASFHYASGTAQQASALQKFLPNDSIDLLVTDPPYYDVVPYADCSDFFYVWLRRMLHGITNFPTESELTPKNEEIVQLAERNQRYKVKTKLWFESEMQDALSIARENIKPNNIAVIVFAHKETSAWEALLQSVLNAGWVITGSWPIDTEKSSRLRANDSAVLSSSIHLVCRPRKNLDGSLRTNDVGDWRDVLHELPIRIHEWLPHLAQEGIVGADAIFACLGPALEIFSRYSSVERADGERVTLKEYLEYVWAAVSKEALNTIFQGIDTSGFEADARLTAMWLWTLSTGETNKADRNGQGNGKTASLEAEMMEEEEEEVNPKQIISGYTLEFDAARKIAQGLGANLDKLSSLVEIKGSTARLRSVTERGRFVFDKDGEELQATKPRKKDRLQQLAMFRMEELEAELENGKDMPTFSVGNTMLDRLHQAMLLFAAGRSDALKRFLTEEGVGQDQRFWRLAQALSSLYPPNSEERRWVEGVQGYKKGLGL